MYHPGRARDAPSRVSRQVEVIDDPKLIAWTRRAYEADLEYRFNIALEEVRKGEWVFLEYRDALQQRPRQAATEMRRVMRDEAVPAEARARAAEILSSLGKADGARFLAAALKSSSADLCAAALEMLNDWQTKIDLTQPDIARQIVKLLTSPNPEVVNKAAHLCAWRKVPGAEEGLRAAVARGQEPLDELAETLARLATKPVVRALNTALEHNDQRERYLGLYTGDQCASFVFADPAAFVPIANRYGLPLSQDPSEGMRAGRAFEEYVCDHLDLDD